MSAGATECTQMEYEFGEAEADNREGGERLYLPRPVAETPGVIIRIIVVIPRKASLLSARSDRERID